MKTQIVVLDAFTINPGDLSWQALQELGECKIYDRTSKEDIVNRAQDAQIILTNKTVIDGQTMNHLPELRYIGVMATGYNVVDVQAAGKKGITVTNVPAYGTAPVAQATLALLLELTNQVAHYNSTVYGGSWSESLDFCYIDHPLIELDGLNMGIIGLGSIGRRVAKLAQAFGMRVSAYTRNSAVASNIPGIEVCSLDQIFSNADVVSLHCPLAPETTMLINKDRLRQMKSSAFLLNTSRGQLIDEVALAEALKQGIIAGAGLDVLSVEPPSKSNPLLNCPNCVITPHVACATKSARKRLLEETAIDNLRAYLTGQSANLVRV